MNTILRYRVTVGSLAFFQSFVSEGHANSHVACLWRTLCVTTFCVDVLYLSQSVSILTEQTAAGLGEIMLFKASHPKEMYGTIQKKNIRKLRLGKNVSAPSVNMRRDAAVVGVIVVCRF